MFTNGTWVQAAFTTNIVIDIRGEVPREFAVPTNWSLTPSGLIGADRFRLMFLTHTGQRPNLTDIAGYNDYIKSQAAASSLDIQNYSYWFRVLGSTADVDARDNTKTNPNTDTSVPIYWMNGQKIADDYGGLYDGSWDSEMSSGRAGTPSSSAYTLWTGTSNNGTEAMDGATSRALGQSQVRVGKLNAAGNPIDAGGNSLAATGHNYYGLSGIFVVPKHGSVRPTSHHRNAPGR